MSSAAHGLAADSVSWLFVPTLQAQLQQNGPLSGLHDYITPVWRCILNEFVIFGGLNLISRQGQTSGATDDNQKPYINFADNLQPKEMPSSAYSCLLMNQNSSSTGQ